MSGTRSAERVQRSTSPLCTDILFDEPTTIKMFHAKLLSNESNKRRLITMLCTEFERQCFDIHQYEEDADAYTVRTALSKRSSFDQVFFIGVDVDLLMLLNCLSSWQTNVYLQKDGRGGSECAQYLANSFTCGEIQVPRAMFIPACH